MDTITPLRFPPHYPTELPESVLTQSESIIEGGQGRDAVEMSVEFDLFIFLLGILAIAAIIASVCCLIWGC